MAFYHEPLPNDAGLVNSLFIVGMITALLGFAIAAAYVAG